LIVLYKINLEKKMFKLINSPNLSTHDWLN